MMLLRARDNNIQSFAYIWLNKENQNEFLKHSKIKELVLISFIKPNVRKTLNSVLCNRSIIPLDCGCLVVLCCSLAPKNWHNSTHRLEVNRVPLSVRIIFEDPKRETQLRTKATAQLLAVVSRNGMAST